MLQLAAASDQEIADGVLTRMTHAGLKRTMILPDFRSHSCSHSHSHMQQGRGLTESRMLPKTRLAPMPANPAALPKALEGTRRSLSFFLTSSFCSLIYACVSACLHLCQHACTCVSMHALVSACMQLCQHACTCVSIRALVSAHVYVCQHMCICVSTVC